MTFLPEKYEMPESPSGYMKFVKGENKFRILSNAIIGYVYFNKENKPVRSREPFEGVPRDMKESGQVKHFWAFVVYNYTAKQVQILELTQKTVMEVIRNYVYNPKWGDPKEYDFIVTRTGDELETKYATTVDPKESQSEEVVNAYFGKKINLEALFNNEDPFALGKPERSFEQEQREVEEIAKEVGF